MSSGPQKARNKAWVAAQPGSRELSPESRAVTLLYPDLHLRVWCNARGINVLCYIDSSDAHGRLHRVEVAHSVVKGPPPKAEDVALWGARALSAWLEARLLAIGESELSGA